MTKLEYLCKAIRAAGNSAAAQILESRTEKEWSRMGDLYNMAHKELDVGETPKYLLNVLMTWSNTPEGWSYWAEVNEQLRR